MSSFLRPTEQALALPWQPHVQETCAAFSTDDAKNSKNKTIKEIKKL